MTTTPRSGLDLQWIDESVRPQDDLFGHVNGKWLTAHEIPEDRASDGAFRALFDQAQDQVRQIIEDAAELEGAEAKMVADLFASFMDEDRIETLGVAPALPLLNEIAAVSDKDSLAELLGVRQREGQAALFGAYVNSDAKDTSRYLLHITQSGLGLPDESYYRGEANAEIRDAYVKHLARMAELFSLNDPEGLASTVMALETAIAEVSWDRVANRDAEKTYNLITSDQLLEQGSGFAWDRWLAGIGGNHSAISEVVVHQPTFLTSASGLWESHSLDVWKMWLTIRTASACAGYLNSEVVEANFDFYGRTLSGTPQLRERWKRGVALVEGVLGEAVGKLYVDQHFSPASKDRMVELVANLIAAYRKSISGLDWMSDDTKARAITKLEKFTPKIGYPDKWKDYSSLDVRSDDLLGNVLRASAWDTDYDLAKLGGPVDRLEWFMTPQTVNAYYNPLMNEIVFPAAILQPPFFDAEADDAANYGGIGAVIGHEIGHGFDDQGSRYDGDGNLIDWWEESDREEFSRRAQALIEQFDVLSPPGLPDHHVNGSLTVGENIGDLGGLTIALKAYKLSLGSSEAPVIDGLTGLQRVLFGWAQVWRAKTREAEALRLLALDPHSPAALRCNATVANLDTFHEVFDLVESDALFKPAEERVRIW